MCTLRQNNNFMHIFVSIWQRIHTQLKYRKSQHINNKDIQGFIVDHDEILSQTNE